MPSWRKAKWGEEISLEYGKAIRGYQNAVAPYRVFGTNGPVGWVDAPLAPGPGVILGRKGAYRGVHFSREPFFVIDTAYYVKPKSEDLDMRWLYFAIIYHKLGEIDDGSPIPSTTRAAVYVRDLEIPPLDEQRTIAATLGALDDKIDLNRRMNETLEAMARALFKDWFVDFGPTRAKMEGREPHLAQEIWGLFPDKLDDDGKPEGWKYIDVGNVIELLDSKRIPLSSRERERRKGPYPYHGATSVMDYVDDYLFDDILLLLGEDGSVARPDGRPYIQYVWGKIWVNNHAHVLRGKSISVEQLKCFFDMTDIAPFVTGAVQPKLNQANLKRIQFPNGGPSLHKAFDDAVDSLFSRIRLNTEESISLAQTRDLLLPKLMSGEIRVADAAQAVQEAT